MKQHSAWLKWAFWITFSDGTLSNSEGPLNTMKAVREILENCYLWKTVRVFFLQ